MNDTDITSGRDLKENDDSTEPTLPSPPADGTHLGTESTGLQAKAEDTEHAASLSPSNPRPRTPITRLRYLLFRRRSSPTPGSTRQLPTLHLRDFPAYLVLKSSRRWAAAAWA
jgi:hypothetical protein